MSPKRRIRPKHPRGSKRNISSHKVHKRRLRSAFLDKTEKKKHSSKVQGAHRTPSPRNGNPLRNGAKSGTPHPPARGPGRPSRFDETEEAFLKNVPEQLKQYAFRPGHAPTPGGGRPKNSFSLTSRLRGILSMPIEGREKKKGKPAVTYADELMALAVQAARRGDYRFFQHIYERIDGKVPDHVVIEEVQQLVAQESDKTTEEVVKIVTEVALQELGEKRAGVFREKLTSAMSEKLGEKDAGRRAG